MSTQKKTIKVLMFLLPAIVSLLAYTAYHEMLFRKPPCLINCDQPSMFSDNEKIKKWLAYLESLRDNTFNNKSSNKRTSPTSLDIAFLQDKINLASNDRDYLSRYQQIISDLTTPHVVKDEATASKDTNGLPEKISQLAYLAEDKDPNNQVFATPTEDESSSPLPNEPKSGPYYVPTGNGPIFFAGSGNPNNNGGSGGGGSDGSNPNGGGNPGGGSSSGGGVPTDPGGNGNTSGGGNPISTVPLPSAGYLIVGLILAIVAVRLKISQRTYLHRL